MKLYKNKISVLFIALLSFSLMTSCEDNNDDDVVATSPLARFTRVLDAKTVTFINISENTTSYSWNFGDGTSSNLINPVKTYTNGTYTIILTASDADGATSTFEDTIIIEGCIDEIAENVDPGMGDLNWTFLNTGGNATFDPFGNIGGAIVENPVLDAVNSSCNVQIYEKINGCEVWSGVGIELQTALDFSTMTNKTFKMKVLAETQLTDVTLRLEFMPFPNVNPFEERIASITQLGQWQELSFDFTNVPTGTFKSVIIYFERNAPCDGDVYYFDDITQE
jgi:hypothetical protein